MSGDVLAIFLFWAASALAAVIGALTAPPGWRQYSLGAMAAIFAVCAAICWAPASSNDLVVKATPLIAALIHSGALSIIMVVSIVALMQRQYDRPEKPSLPNKPEDISSNTNQILDNVRITIESARIAVRMRKVSDNLPRIRAALLTVNKRFGIPIFEKEQGPVDDLQNGFHLLQEIYPLLRAGHIEEARSRAVEIVSECEKDV